MPMRAKHRKQSGFTLLELLVVIVIIGLLVGYVAPRYFSQVGKSEVQVARAQLDALEKALDQYRLDTRRSPPARQAVDARKTARPRPRPAPRRYPTAGQGLVAVVTRPANEPNWTGPYLKRA